MKKLILPALLLVLWSCSEDDGPTIDTSTYEASFNINPASFPAGGGLDLNLGDSGAVAQLDADPAFQYDLKILTIKTGNGGRPGVFLSGNTQSTTSSRALNVSEFGGIGLGSAGFEAFDIVTSQMVDALSADGLYAFDPTVHKDSNGKPDATVLATEYAKLVIGDRIVNLEEAAQPVFLIQSIEGLYYKFQLVNRENGGGANLRWARFDSNAIQ